MLYSSKVISLSITLQVLLDPQKSTLTAMYDLFEKYIFEVKAMHSIQTFLCIQKSPSADDIQHTDRGKRKIFNFLVQLRQPL